MVRNNAAAIIMKIYHNRCGNRAISNELRNIVEYTSKGEDKIKTFEDLGCFGCDGKNEDCPKYFNPLRAYVKYRSVSSRKLRRGIV